MRSLLFILFCLLAYNLQAQGRLEIIQSPDIDTLLMKTVEASKESHQFSGYRIQVFQATDRATAFKMKKELMAVLPDEDVRLIFNEPWYKIRVGNYRNRIEAQALYQQLIKLYPQTFIVPDKIDLDDIK